MAIGPLGGHGFHKGDVEELDTGSREEGGGLVGEAAGFDDDPCDGVGDEAEGVGEAREVESLEGAGVGRGDDEDGARVLDAVQKALLALDALDNAVGAQDLGRIGVRPGADADAVPADDDVALGGRRVGDHGRGMRRGEGNGQGCSGGGGRRRLGGPRGDGAEDGGGWMEIGGGEEEEEDEAGEAEAEDEADEAAEGMEEEPEGRRR